MTDGTMRSNLAQIIAARRVLNVQANVWGGDPRMDQRLPDAFAAKADVAKEELGSLDSDQLTELFRKSLLGHGGEMEKAYEKLMKQQALQKDELPRDLPRNRWPTAGERIDVLQEGNPTRLGASLEECNYQAADLAEDMGEDIKSGPDEFKEKGKEQPKERGPFEV